MTDMKNENILETAKDKKPILTSVSAKMAVAILAVDNIHVSSFGLSILKDIEDRKITYEQARAKIKEYALQLASNSKHHKE